MNHGSYIPFARKYRPQNFQELIGQEVLTKTLSYCIKNKKLSGAILLTGIRGVGKTSSARIIAKTINCTSLENKTDSQEINPCQQCKNCQSIKNNNHPDVIEIDAASRTGVDDVREIIEASEYKPLLGEYKIFIIDEVHMLSKNAFNALLKLIEEPPPHLIFIFATTEVQKIPITVLSRCQRYDLRRFSFEEIMLLLQKIVDKEKLACEEDALKIIAVRSEGSARDAISILDQASSYVHNEDNSNIIKASLVNKMLGLVQISTILNLIKLIVAANTKEAIKLLEDIYVNSSNLEYFLQQVSDFLANLTKEKMIPGYHDGLYKNYSTEIANILIGMSLSKLSILWQIFNNGTHEIKSSHNQLVSAQMLIMKAIYSCNMPKIENILNSEAVSLEQSSGKTQSPIKTNEITESKEIFDFLKFCYNQNEMELYYFLLNEMELLEFGNNILKISCQNKFSNENTLKSLLNQWSGQEWQINISKTNKIISLKDKLLDEVKASEDFAVIKNYFPNSDISDIILK